MSLHLETIDNASAFAPGDTIEGVAGWELEAPPERVEVRLFWHTAGKGGEDVSVVETVRFDAPQAADAQPYRFTTPEGPYAFEGKLITLRWGIELVVVPGGPSRRLSITLSPTGAPIRLGVVEDEKKKKPAAVSPLP